MFIKSSVDALRIRVKWCNLWKIIIFYIFAKRQKRQRLTHYLFMKKSFVTLFDQMQLNDNVVD